MDLGLGTRVALTGLESEHARRLNGVTGEIEGWDAPTARWIVRLGNTARRVKARAENLIVLREHRSTVEPAMAVEARSLLSVTHADAAATGGTCSFGDIVLPADVVLLHVFALLTRHTVRKAAAGLRIFAGEIEAASEVCHEWHGVSLALRALTPACARDVRIKLEMQGADPASADGEFRIWPWGDRAAPPVLLFCHNVLGARPTEFLPLRDASHNLSYFPCGGAARGTAVVSSFEKLRLCPWTLTVKTDDYTFATSAGALRQTYWNGARHLDVRQVPYATARDAAGHAFGGRGMPSPNRGQAQIDLRGTGFAVSVDGFVSVGCGCFGVVAVPADCGANPRQRVQPRIALFGGGYAGRMTPVADRTMDERAAGGNYDDEGRNGGWVLPLVRAADEIPRPGVFPDDPGNMFDCPIATMAQAGMESGTGMQPVRMHIVRAEEDAED
jgi:hypothetical protein